MTRALLVLLLAAALSGTTARDVGAQAPFVYDRELGDIARKTLRQAVTERAKPPLGSVRRVYVRCYRSRVSFEQTFERRFGVPAVQVIAYYAGGGNVHLRGGTCVGVRAFLAGRHTVVTAAAYSVLLHESLHRQGVQDERLANCFANDAVRWGAEWLGFEKEKALHARDLAFAFTRRFAPPAYHMGMPDCLALARRGDWVDHR